MHQDLMDFSNMILRSVEWCVLGVYDVSVAYICRTQGKGCFVLHVASFPFLLKGILVVSLGWFT